MVYNYDKSFGPVIDIVISNPSTGKEAICRGLIAPGCQMTAIPKKIVDLLDLKSFSSIPTMALFGTAKTPVYLINLSIANLALNLNVLSFELQDIVLVGRDILNKFVITLDGKRGICEIKEEE
ncbi:MAG: hypothetical protein AB1630_01170 [bacterium]